ncbi:MAG: amidohydrolase [Candidatus Rariloculaceae bacterium]
MVMQNRRKILKTAVTAAATSSFMPYFASAQYGGADLVVLGGTFHTMDPEIRDVDAMAIRGNRILAVGTQQDLEGLIGPTTRVIQADGMTVTPGFIDAHSHPLMANEAVSVNVDFRRISEVQDALIEQAAKTPPGQWVQAHMYDDTKFIEGRELTGFDIDIAVSDHPVMVRHRGGHTVVVNSKAFEVAGITVDTPDPYGGHYYREGGALTGKVAENAKYVLEAAGDWPVIDRDTMRDSVTLISKRMASVGLTSTTDAGGRADAWTAYMDALERDEMHFRLSFMPRGNDPIYQSMKEAGIRSGFGNAMLMVGGVKFFADGSASERTMRMSEPYEGRPDDYGIARMDQAAIDAAVDDAVENGFRIGIHANGDVTIDQVLNAYERVLRNWVGPNPRFRLEHCSLVTPDLLQRIKDTGSIPAPFYTYAHYHGNKWVEYGEERMTRMFAHRSFIDYGIPVAPASDYTPGPYEPMMAIQSMVTRKDVAGRVWGENQRINVSEAMKVCTVNGAYASFEEDIKGSLTPGKLADFVLLAADPHVVDPDTIKEIPVVATYLNGKATYES